MWQNHHGDPKLALCIKHIILANVGKLQKQWQFFNSLSLSLSCLHLCEDLVEWLWQWYHWRCRHFVPRWGFQHKRKQRRVVVWLWEDWFLSRFHVAWKNSLTIRVEERGRPLEPDNSCVPVSSCAVYHCCTLQESKCNKPPCSILEAAEAWPGSYKVLML